MASHLGSAVVLGLWDGHEASVALVAEGRLVFALSEERPSRQKRASGFPTMALGEALDFADARGLTITDLALAGLHGRAPLRLLEGLYRESSPQRDPLSAASLAVQGWETLLPGLPGLRGLEARLGRRASLRRVADQLPGPYRVHLVPHHDAHAWSALFGAHDEKALIVTWDAYGEGLAATARFAGSPDRPFATLPPTAGLAAVYGGLTHALGFKEGDEGKVMGLAARGQGDRAAARIEELFHQEEAAPRLRRPLSHAELRRVVVGLDRDEVAAGLQRVAEARVLRWLEGIVAGQGRPSRLLLAGGLFANIRINQALDRAGLCEADSDGGVYVFPNMVDGGLSAGAAHKVWSELAGERVGTPPCMHLGPPQLDSAIALALSRAGLARRRLESPAARMAERIGRGEVIAVAAGADEFGPRALGARSILFSAARPELPERVNRGLGRDGFMPFGPAVLDEAAEGLWHGISTGSELGTMTVAVDASDSFARRYPSAVHLDGTTRPQLVTRAGAPRLHELLARLHARDGTAAVINTSFNRHGEPIVHSPEDAIRSFLASDIDALFLGDYEVTKGATAQ